MVKGRPLPAFVALVTVLASAAVAVFPSAASAVQAPVAFSALASPTYQVDGVAWTVAAAGDLVFVGGDFDAARPPGSRDGESEIARTNLVVLDAATGAPTSCAPSVTLPASPGAAAVRALAVSPDGRTLYIGGSFSHVLGVPQQHLAALDIATCSLVRAFRPLPNGPVRAVTADASAVYFGGTLSAVAGSERSNSAAVRAVGTDAPGELLPWAPAIGGELWAVALHPDGGAVVLGGNFTDLGGAPSQSLAVVDPGTGARVRTFPGFIELGSAVKDIAVDATGFYTANEGTGPGVFDGRLAVDWDGYGERWRDTCLGATQALQVHAGVVYSGSHAHDCSTMGAFPDGARRHLLGQSVTDPTLLSWFPDTDDGINETIGPRDLAVVDPSGVPSMYVVGEFTSVNGEPQQGITRFRSDGPSDGPTAPLVSATSPTEGQVRLAWRASSDRDDGLLTYRVYRDGAPTPVHTTTHDSRPWEQGQLTFTDTGLAPGSSHTYRVEATDGTTTTSSALRTATVSGTSSAYRDRVLADGASMLWRYDEVGDVFFADDSAREANGQLVGAGSRVQPGALEGDRSGAFTITGGTVHGVHRQAAPSAFTVETWFRTTTTAGGKLIGFGDRHSGASARYDRHVYMSADGRLVFGTHPGAVVTVASQATYNDGRWHHVAATQGSDGMRLHVDGRLVGQASASTADTGAGYWRIGGDNLAGWPLASGNGSWQGTLDETAVYPTALSAASVAAHHSLGAGVVVEPLPAGSTYRPSDPRRVMDTRTGLGVRTGQVGPRSTVTLQVTGPAGSGLAPVGSTAVALNVTVTGPTSDGFVAVYPAGYAGGPNSSNLNFQAGWDIPNLVVTKVSAAGTVTFYNDQGSTHLVADLQGAYTPDTAGSTYRPSDPRRVMDTRTGLGVRTGQVGPRSTVTLQVTGPAGSGLAPVGSTAVALNVTVTGPTSDGFVAVYPAGYAGGPNSSNLNFQAGWDIPNLVVTKVSAAGTVTFYNDQGSTHLVADLQGAYTPDTAGSTYRPSDPRRVMDTRTGLGVRSGTVGPGETVTLQVTGPEGSGLAPVGSTAVALNVTVTGPTSSGYVAVYPAGYAGGPDSSNLNFQAGWDIPNHVVTKVSAAGTVTFYNRQGSTHLVADLQGAYGP